MVKEIKYTGFTASPSDYECPDGDLAAVLNVVPEEGSLSPVLPPAELFQLTDGRVLRFVHETAYIRNYIVSHDVHISQATTRTLFEWTTDGSEFHNVISFSPDIEIHQVNAIGNTLLILTSEGIHYLLWKGQEDGYLNLGTHMPELPISFGLDSRGEVSDSFFTILKDNIKYNIEYGGRMSNDDIHDIYGPDEEGNYTFTFWDENVQLVQDMLLGAANSVISKAADTGYFCLPFLVRYAYRLYDGSLYMHSVPVLMMASCGMPFAYFAESGNTAKDFYASAYFFRLDYAAKASVLEILSNWSDIIKSVDIFISKPIYKYDQAAEEWNRDYESARYWDCRIYGDKSEEYKLFMKNNYCISNDIYHSSAEGTVIKPYQRRDADGFYGRNYVPYSIIKLPERKQDDIKQDVEECRLFYLLKSIPIKELKSERTIIKPERGYLSNIEAKEVMTDDYDSHDTLIPKYSYGYNARLSLANIRKRIAGGFSADTLFNFTDGYNNEDLKALVNVFFFIKQDNKEFVVSGDSSLYGHKSIYLYLFYPNIYAYKAVIQITPSAFTGELTKLYEVPLTVHETLNGAYFFGGYDFDLYDGTHEYSGSTPTVTPEDDRVVDLPNKIYTSEVNNPFYFPVSGITTVGVGKIFAITSATKALSQGQFGQFPLYAFTDEGVWALEVSKTGAISAVQPFTRDVCINPDSITQLDSSVLFATDRGIMLISGSTSTCISETLDYSQPFQITSLPHSDKLLAFVSLTQADLTYVTFHDFIKGCRMLYSYNRQHIIVFNPDYPYAYVYSLKSKSWGMMQSTIALAIPSYPEALAQLQDGTIVDYSGTGQPATAPDGTLTGIKGVIITRPLKLDAPDLLKTVSTIIQRGVFQRGHIKTAVYGSRDLIHWFIVWTSVDHYLRGFRGTPYKYFRLVLLCDLAPTESVYGCTVQYTPRFTNRLR